MNRFMHYCVPVDKKPADAGYVELLDVYVTDCNLHPMKFEFLYVPRDNTKLPKVMWTNPHIAYEVDNFEELLEKGKVLLQFICPDDRVSRMAFVEYEGAIVELKETVFF